MEVAFCRSQKHITKHTPAYLRQTTVYQQ